MQATTTRPKITVTADGAGVVSHAGSRLLADLADRTTLTGQLSQALDGGAGRERAALAAIPVLASTSAIDATGEVRTVEDAHWSRSPTC